MRIRILLFTIITLFAIKLPTISQDTVNQTIEDHITIDGRTYKVSSDFTIPPGIDKDSPVRLVFTDDTHELLSIERLTDDDSNNDDLEYHFGIVNAISRANTDMEYRVYLDGTGYLFSKDTHIDERTAFLEKYASAALVTRHGKVLVTAVFVSFCICLFAVCADFDLLNFHCYPLFDDSDSAFLIRSGNRFPLQICFVQQLIDQAAAANFAIADTGIHGNLHSRCFYYRFRISVNL